MPELIIDGKTGFLVKTIEQAVRAVKQLQSISRADCRDAVVSKFSMEKMTEDYLRIYEQILFG